MLGYRLLLGGVAPFAAAALLNLAGVSERPRARLPCAIRAVTGVPCPSCGSTRAFLLFMRGDPRWRSYNSVWPIYAVTVAAAGAALLLLPGEASQRALDRLRRRVPPQLKRRWLASVVAVSVAAPAWAIALRRPQIRRG